MSFPVIAQASLGAPASSISLSGLSLSNWILVRAVLSGQCVSGPWERAILRFNDDAGAGHYRWGVMNDDLTNVNNTSGVYIPGIEMAHVSGPDVGTDFVGNDFADIFAPGNPDYYKGVNIKGGMPIGAKALATFGSGFWESKAAITKIAAVSNSTNFAAGTSLKLLGICPGTLSPYSPPSGPQPVTDNFNRADGAIGGGWNVFSPGSNNLGISGNKVTGSSGPSTPSHDACWAAWADGDNHYSQAEVLSGLTTARWVGVTARATALGSNYVLIYFNNGGTFCLMMFKGIAGTYSQIGSTYNLPGNVPLVTGDRIRIEANGTSIRGLLNDVAKISVTDSSVASGKPGIAIYGLASDVAFLDNWQAGAL